MNTKRSGSMKRCHTRHMRRCSATSGRSCSAALRLFFMRQPEPAQRRPDRGQAPRLDAALGKPGLDLGQGDGALGRRQLPQQVLVPGQQRLAVAADPGRGRAAGLAHAADQLDRRRLAHAKRRAASRAELPASTACTRRRRRSCDNGAAILIPRCSTAASNQNQRVRATLSGLDAPLHLRGGRCNMRIDLGALATRDAPTKAP